MRLDCNQLQTISDPCWAVFGCVRSIFIVSINSFYVSTLNWEYHHTWKCGYLDDMACLSMDMLWFKFILGLKFFELVSILFAIVPEYGNEYTTKENKNWTGFKNFAPKLNLNHNREKFYVQDDISLGRAANVWDYSDLNTRRLKFVYSRWRVISCLLYKDIIEMPGQRLILGLGFHSLNQSTCNK